MNDVKPGVAVEESKGISWGPVWAVVFVVLVYYASQALGVLLISIYPSLHHWTTAQANSWLQHSVAAQFVYVLIVEALTVLALYGFLRWRKSDWRAIGWRKPKWSDLLLGLSMLPFYYFTYIIVTTIVHAVAPAIDINQSQQIGFDNALGFGNLLLTFVSLVVLPPFVEELLVRGFLYSSLRKSIPKIGAALLTSVIFASAHLQFGSGAPLLWIAFIDTFVLSLYLIFLRERTHGLWASMTLHASKNLLAFVSLFILHMR